MSDEEILLKGQQAELAVPTQINCPPDTQLTVPDELREPVGGAVVEQEQDQQFLAGIPVWSHKATANCTDFSIGDVVLIEDGRFKEIVYLRQVPAIREETLEYIAKHELEAPIGQSWNDGTLSDVELKRLTGMSLVNARQLLKVLQQAQSRVDQLASSLAVSTLDCYWTNSQQTAICDDTAMAKSGVYAGVNAVYSYTVEEGSVKSYVSQDDADNRALQLAESMLNCFYISDPCTATCESRPDRPMDVMEHVPNDLEPIYPGLSLRVGTYMVAEGYFISYESKEDANEQACALAYSMLNCWYPNLAIEAECERDENGEIRARNMWVDPDLEPPKEADVIARTPGQIVHVPVGLFTSDYSTELATQEAEELAASLLECCFINEEQSIACEAQQIVTAAGETVIVEPDEEYGPREVVIGRGMYASCISQEEANQFAIDGLEGQLNCMYCNVAVPPTCVPDWVKQGAEKGTITLPLSYVISDGTNVTTADALPPEATRGIGNRAVCNPDAQVAQVTAEAMARVPLYKAADCEATHCSYTNWLFIIACAATDPFYPSEPANPGTLYERVSPDGEPYYFYTKFRSSAPISRTKSRPGTGTYMRLDAGIITSQNDETQAEVNKRAFEYIKSMLDCQWENPTSTAECGCPSGGTNCPPEMSSLADGGWALYLNTDYPKTQLTPWSTTGAFGATVARGTITDRSDDESTAFLSIRDKVISMLTSMVVCTYYNREVSAGCSDAGTEYLYPSNNGACGAGSVSTAVPMTRYKLNAQRNLVTIPKETFVGMTPLEADNYAWEAARGLAKCDYDTISELTLPEPSPTPSPSEDETGGGNEEDPKPTTTPTPTPSEPQPTPSRACEFKQCPQYKTGYGDGCTLARAAAMTSLSLSTKVQQEYTIATIKQRVDQARARLNQLKAKQSI